MQSALIQAHGNLFRARDLTPAAAAVYAAFSEQFGPRLVFTMRQMSFISRLSGRCRVRCIAPHHRHCPWCVIALLYVVCCLLFDADSSLPVYVKRAASKARWSWRAFKWGYNYHDVSYAGAFAALQGLPPDVYISPPPLSTTAAFASSSPASV